MRLNPSQISPQNFIIVLLAAILLAVMIGPGHIEAQHAAPTVAQVGAGSPLPVYVVNDFPGLPEGFVPGTTWRFTTWTVPTTLTFTAAVQKTEGGWALLAVTSDNPVTPKWYYIPQMPGTWEVQN